MTKKKTVAELKRELATANAALETLAASPITDLNFFPSGMSNAYSNRTTYDREKIFNECLRAWRVNPIARAIVSLRSAFIVGDGYSISAKHKAASKFLSAWWNHPLNKFDLQLSEWCDEQTRAGNIFFLVTVDQHTGMSYFRAFPAEQIKDIKAAPNDVMQEKFYAPQTMADDYPAYNHNENQETFMLHYAVNRPVGSLWGEPTLAPILTWIGRYANWLEDRVRLNRFRNVFMYILAGNFPTEAARQKREAEVNANPPQPGSILVTNPATENWGVMSAKLDSFDASLDGMSIKRMLAAGAMIPMHWLAEPESSTRTTAEAAGTPTFRALKQEQTRFIYMLQDMARIALQVRKKYDTRINAEAEIEISAPDITERDNSALALAVSRIYPALADLFDRDGIDEAELLRLVYRMSGESYEQENRVMQKKPIATQPPPADPAQSQPSGEPTNAP